MGYPPERAQARANIGNRIREALRAKHISQRQLASELAIGGEKGSSTITGWVQGVTQPSLEELAEICRLTGVSADWILGLPGAMPPAQISARVRDALKKVADGVAELGHAYGTAKDHEEGGG